MKRQSIIRLALAAVFVIAAGAGCDTVTGQTGGMTFGELEAELRQVEPGNKFVFTLEELTPAARIEYLRSIGRPGASPEDYLAVPITYEVGDASTDRGSTRCVVAVSRIAHDTYCRRPGYSTVKEPITNYGRCPHDGFTEVSAGSKKTVTCDKARCTYLYQRWVYYHRSE